MQISYKHICKITIPVLVSLLMEYLIGFTDTAYLGRVGETELAASALAGTYYMIIYMIGFGFSIIAVRLNSTTIKIVCSTADFPRSSIFFSFPSPPNQKVMDLEVTPRRISTPFPSPFQDY